MAEERKRSSRIIMTNEARVLKELRIQRGLSMRKVGELLGLSDSYIAHIETGRVDVPKGERLETLLKVYGGMKPKSFYERVRKYHASLTPFMEIEELLKRATTSQLVTLLGITRALLAQGSEMPKNVTMTGTNVPFSY